MQFDSFLDKKVTVTQVKSSSKLTAKQKGGLVGLGLRGIGSSSELKCDKSILGMIKKLHHVIEVVAS